MKKYYLLFLFCLFDYWACAQVQHVGGVRSLDVGYGVSKYGSVISGGYVMYLSRKVYLKGIAYYEVGKDDKAPIDYRSIGVDVALAYNLFKVKETFYFNALGGLTVSSDATTNETQSSLGFSIPSTMKFGGLGGIETETFISQKFVFIATFSQRYFIDNGSFGSNRWFAQAGIRYNFQ